VSRLLSRFDINIQVGVIGVVALLGFVLIGILYFGGSGRQLSSETEMDSATKSRSATKEIVINLLQLRRHEKDFLLRHDDTFVAEHAKVAETVIGDMKNLANDLIPAERMLLQQIAGGLTSYLAQFKAVAVEGDAIGLTEELGLRGTVRQAVHEIEDDVTGAAEAKLTISMLTMRRYEKDFMERQDRKYAAELQQEATTFANLLPKSALSSDTLIKVRDRLAKYQEKFARLAEAMLREKQDIQKVSSIFHEIEPQIDALRNSIVQRAETQSAANIVTQTTIKTLITSGLVGVALTVVLFSWLI
jgi:methyl-accepting chemotaxis protein